MLFVIISIVFLVISPAETPVPVDSVLYLKYEEPSEEIERIQIGQPPSSYIYDYHILYKGIDYKPISFIEPDVQRADTTSLENIKAWDIKSHIWLKEYFLEYFNYFEGESPYINKDGTARFFNIVEIDQVVIVEIDEEKKSSFIALRSSPKILRY